MAEPKPIPEESPEERPEIRKFRQDYGEAIAQACVSAEHTATQGWQDLYGEHRDKVRKLRLGIADSLKGLEESARVDLLTEEQEKRLGEIKKYSGELRALADWFQQEILNPIVQPMHDCARIIEAARNIARAAQTNAPLHTRGIVEDMEAAIETQPHVKFMAAAGRIMVSGGN